MASPKKAAKKVTKKVRKTIVPVAAIAPVPVVPPAVEAIPENEAQKLIAEMVAGGASKLKIAETVGVSNQTILSIASGKTATFRKQKELKKVYDQWKAGKIVLKGQRGRKSGVVVKKVKKEELTEGDVRSKVKILLNKPIGKNDFPLPHVTEDMVAKVEQQIHELKLQAQYMKDLLAIKKKYGK